MECGPSQAPAGAVSLGARGGEQSGFWIVNLGSSADLCSLVKGPSGQAGIAPNEAAKLMLGCSREPKAPCCGGGAEELLFSPSFSGSAAGYI